MLPRAAFARDDSSARSAARAAMMPAAMLPPSLPYITSSPPFAAIALRFFAVIAIFSP